MSLSQELLELTPQLVELRHAIHADPEPGFAEVRTQARIRAALEAAGLHPRVCAGTGLIVDIGDGEGPTIALRADIDCLRMTEENFHLSYRSQSEGLAHMCGHDGHTATLVGAGVLLAKVADRLPGRVRLLFQPAEEGPGGAPKMIEEGCLEGVDEVYGMHNWPTAPLGSVRLVEGACMATVAQFSVTLHGQGTHASQPHQGVDPVIAAAQLVTALNTIISRDISYIERAVVSVTTLSAGEAFNVIPDTATLGGTVRALSDATGDLIAERIHTLVEQTAAAFRCRGELTYTKMYPCVVNTPAETEHVRRVAGAVFKSVSDTDLPMLAAEDFAYYLQHRPGCFFFLGGGEDGRSNSMCHATDYDYNDNLIAPGVRMWMSLVADRLGVELG